MNSFRFSLTAAQSLVLPNSLKYLGFSNFRNRGAFNNLILGDGLETIESECFYN
jgi:hypothetical protein